MGRTTLSSTRALSTTARPVPVSRRIVLARELANRVLRQQVNLLVNIIRRPQVRQLSLVLRTIKLQVDRLALQVKQALQVNPAIPKPQLAHRRRQMFKLLLPNLLPAASTPNRQLLPPSLPQRPLVPPPPLLPSLHWCTRGAPTTAFPLKWQSRPTSVSSSSIWPPLAGSTRSRTCWGFSPIR